MSNKDDRLTALLREWGERVCDLIADDIYEYSQGRIVGSRKAKVERHLKECPDCHQFYTEIMAEFDAMDRVPRASVVDIAKEKIHNLVSGLGLFEKIRQIKSTMPLTSFVYAAEATRSLTIRPDTFVIGEEINILIEPDLDGYLVIFLLDSTGNSCLVFPANNDDETFVSGGSDKLISVFAVETTGQTTIKAILTSKELLKIADIRFETPDELNTAIEKYLKDLTNVSDDEIAVSDLEFEISSDETNG